MSFWPMTPPAMAADVEPDFELPEVPADANGTPPVEETE